MSHRKLTPKHQALYLRDTVTRKWRRATYGDVHRIFRKTVPSTDSANTLIQVDNPMLQTICLSLGFENVEFQLRRETK